MKKLIFLLSFLLLGSTVSSAPYSLKSGMVVNVTVYDGTAPVLTTLPGSVVVLDVIYTGLIRQRYSAVAGPNGVASIAVNWPQPTPTFIGFNSTVYFGTRTGMGTPVMVALPTGNWNVSVVVP